MHFYDAVRVPGVKGGHCRARAAAMPPSLAFLTSRQAAPDAVTSRARVADRADRGAARGGTRPHVLERSRLRAEAHLLPDVGRAQLFLARVLRRPAIAAALSLAMIVVLILVSRLKYDIIWMTANFLDLMIINGDTISFLLAVKPDLDRKVLLALALIASGAGAALVDRQSSRAAANGGDGIPACAAALVGIGAGDRAGGLGHVRRRRLRVQILALGRCRQLRPDDPRIYGFRAALTDRLKTLPEASLHAAAQSRRTSFWCTTNRASTSGSCPA